MSDLRDAAELALTALENTCPNNWTSVKENLRRALAQPKREWVGLTDEEMDKAMEYWSDKSRSSYGGAESASEEYVDMVSTWRYIEAKLKEKNT
jgi:hypothetical protein